MDEDSNLQRSMEKTEIVIYPTQNEQLSKKKIIFRLLRIEILRFLSVLSYRVTTGADVSQLNDLLLASNNP